MRNIRKVGYACTCAVLIMIACAPDVITEDLGDGVTLKLVRIPAGSYLQGASPGDNEADANEKPAMRAKVSKDFLIGITEVTQAQWNAVMGVNPSQFMGDDLPVEQVTWLEAVRFCEELSGMTGHTYRLPTEKEWEYAARAGSTTRFHWGERVDGEYAWYGENSMGRTHPAGQKRPNGWGLYDTAGNVFEWCTDTQYSDPGIVSGASEMKYLRGGSYSSLPVGIRVSNRQGWILDDRYGRQDFGFRIVREIE